MEVEFSEHSKRQSIRRKIPKEWVLEAVENPEETRESFKSRELRRKRFGNKILEVVIVAEGEKIVVVTQYFLGTYDES